MSKQRSRMRRSQSRKDFRKKSKPHGMNSVMPSGMMRGGIRL